MVYLDAPNDFVRHVEKSIERVVMTTIPILLSGLAYMSPRLA